MVEVGDKIRILYMEGEPDYSGKEGIVCLIDDMGQIHLDSCGCAVIPEVDSFTIIEKKED